MRYFHRRSIRLRGYDYSQCGVYFVTICTQDRQCVLGKIDDDKNTLSKQGQMVNKWWNETENKFPEIDLHDYMIMPNHLHGIIQIVGADLCVCPKTNDESKGEHTGSPLHKIIQWFKTMTTNEYIKNVNNGSFNPFVKRLWQRNYWERIIRNEREYYAVKKYIFDNPMNWNKDDLFIE